MMVHYKLEPACLLANEMDHTSARSLAFEAWHSDALVAFDSESLSILSTALRKELISPGYCVLS